MHVIFRFFSRCPLWLLHSLGAFLGWATYLCSPTYRRRFIANAQQAGLRLSQVRGAIAHAGRMSAELPRLWIGPAVPVRIEGADFIEQAYKQHKGIVFFTPHMGSFEITAQAVSAVFGPRYGPMTVLYRPPRKAYLAELLHNARERTYLQTAPTTLAGVRQMIRALRKGYSVGLLPDQVPPNGQGVWAPFFGRSAYTMTLAARLVQQTGAAILFAWGERLPHGKGFVVHILPTHLQLASDMEEATCQINQAMESVIRLCPEQYLWGYARYKMPRGMPAQEGTPPVQPPSAEQQT